MNEEVILTFENWPMFQVRVYYQIEYEFLLSAVYMHFRDTH